MSFSQVRWLWIGVSGASLALGAALAVTYVPQAAFAQNPTGLFGWHLIEFALWVAMPFAVAQWFALLLVFPPRYLATALTLLLWIPATSVGVMAMILPLWWYDATAFMYAPWIAFLPMLPGIVLLAVLQWLALIAITRVASDWLLATTLGAVVGVELGLFVGFSAGESLEILWTLVTGLTIGAFQGHVLAGISSSK